VNSEASEASQPNSPSCFSTSWSTPHAERERLTFSWKLASDATPSVCSLKIRAVTDCGAERGRLRDVRPIDPASFGVPRGTRRPGRAAATRTIRKRSRCRRPPPAGRRLASPTAVADSAEDLVPGDADGSLGMKIIQAPVEFFALGLRERNCLGRRCQAASQRLEQAEPLLCCQCCDVEF